MDKTINVVSTPNIQGNIGSCETKKVESTIRAGVLTSEYQVVLTNSCTGKVINQYNYVDSSGIFWVPFLVVIGLVFSVWLLGLLSDF